MYENYIQPHILLNKPKSQNECTFNCEYVTQLHIRGQKYTIFNCLNV